MSDARQLGLGIDVGQVGELTTWTLRYPFLPPSKNVYDQWPGQWKSSAKNKWYRETSELVKELDLPHGLRKIGIHARLVFPTRQRRDPQNYAQSLWHWLPDALVRCGVLEDDRDGAIEIGQNWGIEMAVDSRTHVPKKARQRTIVTIAAHVFDEPTHTRLERG